MEGGDLRAAFAVEKVRQIYMVERKANEQGVDHEARGALRRSETAPIIDELMRWVHETYENEPPKSSLRKGLTYIITQHTALRRFLEDGRLPPDNNDCERELRQIAIGRKNYLFSGSDEAAERSAVLYTVLGTCVHAGVEPMAYLCDVMQKIADGWPQSRLDELLPPYWSPIAA
jgi:transposase